MAHLKEPLLTSPRSAQSKTSPSAASSGWWQSGARAGVVSPRVQLPRPGSVMTPLPGSPRASISPSTLTAKPHSKVFLDGAPISPMQLSPRGSIKSSRGSHITPAALPTVSGSLSLPQQGGMRMSSSLNLRPGSPSCKVLQPKATLPTRVAVSTRNVVTQQTKVSPAAVPADSARAKALAIPVAPASAVARSGSTDLACQTQLFKEEEASSLSVGAACQVAVSPERFWEASEVLSPITVAEAGRAGDGGRDQPLVSRASTETEGLESEDVVQFCAAMFYCKENEESAKLSVMRIGTLQGTARVDWETQDIHAGAGSRQKYETSSGTLHFAPGQDHAEIEITVFNDDIWETSMQFLVLLKNNVSCELGRYLFQSHVTIIDDDTFPSNRYDPEEGEYSVHSDEAIEEIPGYLLMYDFLKHCLEVVPGVGRRTLAIIILDQLHTLYYMLRTYLVSIYMVDVVFARDPKGTLWAGTQEHTALLVALLIGAPIPLLHYWDYCKEKMDVAGDLRTYFQTGLICKYFNFDEKERARINVAEIQGAIRTETREIVEGAFMKCFTVFKLLGKLVIVSAFVLRENPYALSVVILYPLCTLTWLWLRIGVLVKFSESVVSAENLVCDSLQTACQSFRLISDYGRRPELIREIDKKIEALNMNMFEKQIVVTNNLKFTTWLSTGLTVAYVLVFSRRVIHGELSLGTFLAMVKVFSELGDEFKEALEETMELTGAIGPLQKIVRFMNGPQDTEDSLKMGRYNLEQTLSRREELREKQIKLVGSSTEGLNNKANLDSLPIFIAPGMQFKYDVEPENEEVFQENKEERSSQGEDYNEDLPWSLGVDEGGLQLEQGVMVSISGIHGSGKASTLRLFAGIAYPSSGNIFVPSHLRLLHVSHDTMLLEKGLVNNLTFGAVLGRVPRKQRIIDILGRFAKFTKLQMQLKAEYDDEDLREGDGLAWRGTLSQSEKAVVHIARALVMNPEVMVLHRPIVHFDHKEQETLMRILKEHVSERGVAMGAHRKELRRPRTVIYSTDFPWAAEMADVKLFLDSKIHTEGHHAKESILRRHDVQ